MVMTEEGSVHDSVLLVSVSPEICADARRLCCSCDLLRRRHTAVPSAEL